MAIYYKGFNRDLTCRGFQFKEGETYREENASLCHSGFHACESPLDTFAYYNPGTSVYHEVELNDVSDERHDDDTKVCAKEIKIGARLNIPALVSAQIEYIKKKCTSVENSKKAANAGYRGAANAGDCGAATSRGRSSVGENGIAIARGDGGVRVKGGLGSILVIAIEEEDSFEISDMKCVYVDGEKIKADVWYKLYHGEFEEVCEA